MDNPAQHPISLPGHPFWTIFKRFGRDEIVAMLVNVVGTGIISIFYSNLWVLSVTGPVIEKIGFFPAHFWEAWKIYSTTSRSKRKSIWFYIKNALKGGGVSLGEDILIHDPLYIVMMLFGVHFFSSTPVWVLAGISFALAVIIVSGLEFGCTEIRYLLFKRKMLRLGFENESYYEARFLVSFPDDDRHNVYKLAVLGSIADEFGLDKQMEIEYDDQYFGSKLPSYSGRVPKVRFRDRGCGKSMFKSVQAIYTRASEMLPHKMEQCRYFPIKKDKFYAILDSDAGSVCDFSLDEALRRVHCTHEVLSEVNFYRILAHNKELLASVDIVNENRPYFLVELKVFKDVKLLIQAMRFVMTEFSVIQTTHMKPDLVALMGESEKWD
jgi:hypothetical protein